MVAVVHGVFRNQDPFHLFALSSLGCSLYLHGSQGMLEPPGIRSMFWTSEIKRGKKNGGKNRLLYIKIPRSQHILIFSYAVISGCNEGRKMFFSFGNLSASAETWASYDRGQGENRQWKVLCYFLLHHLINWVI